MGQLIVRRLDDAIKAQIKERAKRHGRSLEAEVRAIVEDAIKRDNSQAGEAEHVGFGTLMRQRFSKIGLTPLEARKFNDAIEDLRRGSKPRDPGFEP